MAEREIRVADEVWIAVALLHREQPGREDFSVREIIERAEREDATRTGRLRPGVRAHASQHCVANKPPNPGRYRMLLGTGRGRRRLYIAGDPCHPAREGAKILPREADLPEPYRALLVWYRSEYARTQAAAKLDPILALRGLGREIWADEDADAYVCRLRKGWE